MIANKIKIDLRTDQEGYDAGIIGEINQRTLEIIPPKELQGAGYFRLVFELDGREFYHTTSFPGGKFVRAKIAPPITMQPAVPMTLEAYNEDGTILGKSQMVALHFGLAVQGELIEFATSADLAAEIAAREQADAAHAQALAAETAAREQADAALAQDLAAEAAAREQGDADLAQDLAAETAARIADDEALTQALAAEATAREQADADLAQALADEAAAREQADAAHAQAL
jgi:hypothetical protein